MAREFNQDGLLLRYGPRTRADQEKVREYRTHGPRRFMDIEIRAEALPAFSAGVATLASVGSKLPKNSIVEAVEVYVEEPFTGGAGATLNVGLVSNINGTTDLDIDAFVAAATIAELTPIGLIKDGVSPADGSGRGVKYDKPMYVTYSVGTANFTNGTGKVRVYYSAPDRDADTLIQP